MKKLDLFFLVFFVSLAVFATAQPVVNGVMQGSPRTFMVNPSTCNSASGWARAYNATYPSSSQTSATTEGPSYTLGTATSWSSHELKIRTGTGSPTDPQTCHNPVPGFQLPIFPLAWNSNDFPANSGFHYEDTVMRVGNTSGSAKSAKMEYSFIPDTINPVLLVAYECVLQAPTHTRVQNPSVLIQVSQNNTTHNDLLPLGYYPSDYITNGNNTLYNNPNCPRNNSWPYARYFYQAEGSDGPTARPAEMTPSAFYSGSNFPTYECGSGYSKIVSTKYVTVAFNLMEQARNNTPVKFKIIIRGCSPSAHYAYIYFTAKMVPGKISVDACPERDTVEMTVPWGFDANTYRWYQGLNSDPDKMVALDPSSLQNGSNNYTVKVPRGQLMPYYRCEMESETGVPFVYEAHTTLYDFDANFSYEETEGNCKHNITFNSTGYNRIITPAFSAGNISVPADTSIDPNPIMDWYWLRGPNDQVRLGNPNDTMVHYTFDRTLDSVQVRLTVNTSRTQSCSSRDTTIWVHFDPKFVHCPTSDDTIHICESSMVNGKYTRNVGDTTYTWEYHRQVVPIVYKAGSWNGCDSTVNTILLVEKPKVEVTSLQDYCDNFETTLETDKSGPGYRWEWSTGDTSETLTVDRAGTYAVTVTDPQGCKASGNINIPTCKPFVNLVNAITPSGNKNNADPYNDCFYIPQWKLIKYVEFNVFTRNGELIYSYKGDPKNLKWCGTHGNTGKPVEYNVVYPYTLKYTDLDGVSKVIKSTITVL